MTTIRADAERSTRNVDDHERAIAQSPSQTPPRASAPGARETPALRDHATARHIDAIAPSSDYASFLSSVASAASSVSATDAARDVAVQAKLDGLRDAFSGPYAVAGSNVSARPMFRMTAHDVPRKMALEAQMLGLRAGVFAPMEAFYGQCKPHDLVKITQALIDAGRLPPAPGDVASRIRRMQWDYGIGVDCAGYSKQAILASSPHAVPLRAAGAESFRDLDGARARSFAKLPIEKARPGDLITLDPGPNERWGHNVVVYSHVMKGALHVLEVDSSWGAGSDGSEQGGFRRDTWTYDPATKLWGSHVPGSSPPLLVTSGHGPAGDRYHGTYRPRPG